MSRKSKKIKINKAFVDLQKNTESGQRYFYDQELSGFGLVVGKRSKSYFAEKLVNKKCCRKTIGKHGHFTPEQARQEAQKLLYQMAQGKNPVEEKKKRDDQLKAARRALQDVWDEFKEERDLKAATLNDYGNYMKSVFADWLDEPVKEITREMVSDLHHKLGNVDEKRSYANGAMRILRSVLSFAKGKRYITENPVDVISETRRWYPEKRRQTVIKSHQLPAWFKALHSIRGREKPPSAAVGCDYLEFVLFTGLRRNEAATLTWTQIDLEDKTLTIENTKNGKTHRLPLTDHLVTILERRRDAAGESPWVFPSPGRKNRAGHLTEPRFVADIVEEEAGVKFTIHDLRRTFVTTADRLNLSYLAVKRLVNHTMSGDVTAGYIVADVERLREPMQAITDEFLAQAAKGRGLKLTATSA